MKIFESKNNPDQYYIGTVKRKINNWLIVQAIDENGNLGGLEILDSNQFKVIDKAKAIDFYESIINQASSNDIYHLASLNEEVLGHNFQDIPDLLTYLCENKMIITLNFDNGAELSGMIVAVRDNQILLKEKTDEFELSELCVIVNINQIVNISINDEANIIFQKWLKIDQIPDSGICAFYPMYDGDDRFTDYLAGKILDENNNYFLVQAVDDVGQLSAITMINKDYIAHVSEDNAELDYLNFAVNEQTKNNMFDPLNLTKKIDHTIIHRKDIKQIILDYPSDCLLSIDDINFDAQDLGYLSEKDKDSFTLKVVDDFSINKSIKFKYDEIVSIDLTSFEIEKLGRFLANMK